MSAASIGAISIALDIPVERIANLFASAVEGGDPVTTARRGGWCEGIRSKKRSRAAGDRYARPDTYRGDFLIEITEIDDETTGHKTKHIIHKAHVRHGLKIMAENYPRQFGQITTDNIDAPCADIFLQCTLFGKEKYA